MPRTTVVLFRTAAKTVPLQKWLDGLKESEPKAYDECLAYIRLLERYGFDLRRPVADYLRDEIYELRPKANKIHYRMLYFYCGKNVACLSNGFIKKTSAVPNTEIEFAIKANHLVDSDFEKYTAELEI